MTTSEYRWYELGPFRIFVRPLTLNPYWSTHWIYRDGRLLGKQLSVPIETDCQWHEREGGVYAEKSAQLRGYTAKRRATPARQSGPFLAEELA